MFKKISALFVVSVFSIGMAACGGGGSSEASCDGVADHMFKLAKKEIENLKGQEKQMAEAMFKGMAGELKKQIVKQCKDEKWSKDAMQCMVSAKSEDDMDKCKDKVKGGGGGDTPAGDTPPAGDKTE